MVRWEGRDMWSGLLRGSSVPEVAVVAVVVGVV